MVELSVVDASGVRQTRTRRSTPQPTGASSGQPRIQSRDFAREVPVDTALHANPIGQLAGAFAEAKQRFQAEVAADRLILDDIGADRRGRPVAAAVFGRWLTPSLA